MSLAVPEQNGVHRGVGVCDAFGAWESATLLSEGEFIDERGNVSEKAR